MNIWTADTLPKQSSDTAVTIGNFDGVHQGHQHILRRLKNEAQKRGLSTLAIIFEPQASEFFAKQRGKLPIPRLSPLRDKLALLQDTQCLDAVCVVRFRQTFSQMPAKDFVQNILLKQWNTRYLLVGDDFRFGKDRVGDFEYLSQYSEFVTEKTDSVMVADGRASSTAIRLALGEGNIALAEQILGHPYALSGKVKHGKKMGRLLGSPTANIHLPDHVYALQGVFVVDVMGDFGCKRGVASFGFNPTVEQSSRYQLEVHLFDFCGDLYGKRLQVRFLHKLRDEQRFADVAELTLRIQQDIALAKAWQG